MISRKVSIQNRPDTLDQRKNLQNGVILRVPAVYCRNLVIRHLDETVPGSDIHAVVQDLCEDRLGYLVQGVPGNAGPFQNRLDCTGSHRVSLTVDLEQQAGVLHRVGNNLRTAVVVIELQVQFAHLRVLLQGLEHEVPGRCCHPAAVLFPFLQELNEITWVIKCASEVVCVNFLVCHWSIPPFKLFSNPLFKRNLDKKIALRFASSQIKAHFCGPLPVRLECLSIFASLT